ncbi:MAG: YybH family protein [Candidatus Acidiferrales bacterium]
MLNRNGWRTPIASVIAPMAMFFLLLVALTSRTGAAAPRPPSSDETQIRTLLEDQTAAWNRGDIEGFMAGYWKSDETEFVSAEGIARGWQALLDRYRRGYPDRKAMGQLSFSNLEIRVECPNSAYAIGEYHLQREKDNPSGIFTLNFRKFPEGWRVVVDHTTAFAPTSQAAKQK